MKRFLGLGVIAALLVAGCAGQRMAGTGTPRLTLAEGGVSDFVIVVADDASTSTKYGAEELQRWLKEMTGAALPIVSDSQPVAAHEIVLGDNAHLRGLDTAVDFDALGNEGYVIRTVGPHLVIAGGALRGNLYGVYGLLEDHLGCRWFTPEVSRIPKRDTLALGPIDDRQVPTLEYREPFTVDCFDGDWCARNRMNSSSGRLEAKHGGNVRFGAGMFVHTFNSLVPPEKYFDAHPEYFSEIDGKRVKDHSQLCCTNEDVIQLCIQNTREAMRSDPDAFVWSVSQNDWGNYCQCAKCQALAASEDSQMAPVLQLVNRVAEAVESEFPDKAIETLAYQWTRKPCKTMRPRHNVIVRLCSIECCFMHPLATCDQESNRAFCRDAEGWAVMADRLWVWDYVTSFRHYMTPFPNLHVRNDNIQFFIKNHVTGIFEQDVYTSFNGELSPLSGYVMANFLWNQDYDEDQAIDEFLEGVYGDAAKPIRRYIDMLEEKVTKDNIHANIWVGPNDVTYLDDKILAKADRLWDKAEACVSDQPEVLERVKIARLCVEYAVIERARAAGLDKRIVEHEKFQAVVDPALIDRVKRFFEVARRANVTRIDESTTTLDQYDGYFQGIVANPVTAYVPHEPADAGQTACGLDYAYYEGDFEALPDFATLPPVKQGQTSVIDLSVRGREDGFALLFTGYVKIARNGLYTFSTESDDGSALYIGDECVAMNDGLHGPREVSGVVALKAGLHPIRVAYFDHETGQGLAVRYEGPGVERCAIPAKVLYRAK